MISLTSARPKDSPPPPPAPYGETMFRIWGSFFFFHTLVILLLPRIASRTTSEAHTQTSATKVTNNLQQVTLARVSTSNTTPRGPLKGVNSLQRDTRATIHTQSVTVFSDQAEPCPCSCNRIIPSYPEVAEQARAVINNQTPETDRIDESNGPQVAQDIIPSHAFCHRRRLTNLA